MVWPPADFAERALRNIGLVIAPGSLHLGTRELDHGEKKIIVPPDAPIVAFAPGDKGDLKPGVKIFIVAAKKQADGSLQAPRINYGKDGLTPPM